ncbi:hypothetical protein [Parafrankia sp. EUN1f]|uniref:hypothetical protein n=1 Tax=Parafrankia sp. EUN1f TaxID=102897 RepID=UPI0001C47796|nr:hypothetical protein [Parafrankia sp. EUN1f]EFC86817.1 hypothetical protein FrEUN1fDRAFT_0068 [Parafrankia sp. EUN1f]
MSKKLVQRGTNMIFTLLLDGNVFVEDPATGQSGVFTRDGLPVSGELKYADQVMLDYVAGAYTDAEK